MTSVNSQATANKCYNYLPSVKHYWDLRNPFHTGLQNYYGYGAVQPKRRQTQRIHLAYGPFSIGRTRWQLEFRIPEFCVYLRRVAGDARDEHLEFVLKESHAHSSRMLTVRKQHLFTSTEQDVKVADFLKESECSQFSFTFEALVRPENYAGGLPCDFRIFVLDRSDEGGKKKGKQIAEFAAHRSVLSKGWPVFEEMLQEGSESEATKTGVIDIGNFAPKTVRSLLVFIYTGRIVVCKRRDPFFCGLERGEHSEVLELLAAAEKYKVDETLRKACSVRILEFIDCGNAVEQLAIAERYHWDQEEKQTVMRFIRDNRREILRGGQNDEALKQLSPETTLELLKLFAELC